MNDWVNNREAGDLRRYRAHYDVTVMCAPLPTFIQVSWISASSARDNCYVQKQTDTKEYLPQLNINKYSKSYSIS